MRIHFYTNCEDELEITSFNNMESNPFNVGDSVHLTVGDLVPRELDEFKHDVARRMIVDNDHLKSNFHLKEVKLVKVGKYVRFNLLNKPTIVIEYHCEIID